MTLQPLPSGFPYIWGEISFLFYQCIYDKLRNMWNSDLHIVLSFGFRLAIGYDPGHQLPVVLVRRKRRPIRRRTRPHRREGRVQSGLGPYAVSFTLLITKSIKAKHSSFVTSFFKRWFGNVNEDSALHSCVHKGRWLHCCTNLRVMTDGTNHRLNMEVDLQSYLGSMSRELYSFAKTPQPPNPPAFGLIYKGAIGQQR